MRTARTSRGVSAAAGGGGQVISRGLPIIVDALFAYTTATAAGAQLQNLKDGGSSGAVKWEVQVNTATAGNAVAMSFPLGLRFDDGLFIGTSANVTVWAAVRQADPFEG